MKEELTTNIKRNGKPESPWQHGLTVIQTEIRDHGTEAVYDCLIVGGGITGITAALMLQNAGKKTLIAEAVSVGFGTTGGTSAHINTFADTTYTEAESAFGEDGAKLFARAVNEGLAIISDNIKTYNIDCDYEIKPGYVYAEDDNQIKQLKDLYDGMVKVGVPVNYTEDVPVPVPYKKAVILDNQAQFHPLKYLLALQQEYLNKGGIISENTRVDKITTEDNVHTAHSTDTAIKARNIIYATHTPPNINVFNFSCAAYRSYVLGVKLKGDNYPDALIYDLEDPYHYFRTHVIDGQQILLVGGNDHKTGHGEPEKVFDDLEKYVRKYYDVSSVKYKWSSQYYIPADGLPFTGQMPLAAKGIYCATGFNGNGMMLGSVSAKILSDLVCGKESPYTKIFNPSRVKPIDSFADFVSENADVAYHFFADRFSVHKTDSLKRISPGTGRVVEVDGKKVAAYRDEKGRVHALNPVCTHAKCFVGWNQAEKSWDCPCHGARYDIYGNVLTGPATAALQKIDN